jgi:hypothetical protein
MPITPEVKEGIERAAATPEGEEVRGLFDPSPPGPGGPESVKEQLTELQTSTIPPGEEQPRQRRKYTKRGTAPAVQASPEGQPFDPEGLGMLVRVLVSWGDKRMPNPIPTSETELELLSKTTTELAKKYMPKAMEYSVELAFVTAAVVWTLPRLQRPEPPARKIELDTEASPT